MRPSHETRDFRLTDSRWTAHIVQSFVHGANAAIAHLQFEAVLASAGSHGSKQAGRPFVVTDPNPPIAYRDLYLLIETLAITPFRTLTLQPAMVILLSHVLEAYIFFRLTSPVLGAILPPLSGDIKHLRPALLSICTHLVASNELVGLPVSSGGLGYTGVLTTLEGMTQEVVEWNQIHRAASGKEVSYRSSVALADDIQKATARSTNHEGKSHVFLN